MVKYTLAEKLLCRKRKRQGKMSNISAASAPSSRDIFGTPGPNSGFAVGPGNNTMGLGGPNVPSVTWEPRTANGRYQSGPAKFLDYGVPPSKHGHITLKSVEFIQCQYMSPPLNDQADLLLMPDMPVFTVNELDPTEDTTLVLSHAKCNKLFQDQFDDFELAREPGAQGTRDAPTNPHFNTDSHSFHEYLTMFGEAGLEDYAYAESHGQKERIAAMDAKMPYLKRFWQLSTSSEFCWLTRYGILKRISFSGVVINTNRAVGLEAIDNTEHTDHYVQVNVGIGKRVRCAQLFGMSDEITTGSKVWIILTRKPCGNGKYGAFKLQPGGSKTLDYPLSHQMSYVDQAGMQRTGFRWILGVVIEPANANPQAFSLEQANNTGYQISERNAYDAHATLPTLYLALGFKN